MFETNDAQRAHAQGRSEQYREMMEALAQLEGRYKGVRGELLKKVRAELEKHQPPTAGLSLVSPREPEPIAGPRCRACGRELKRTGTDGTLMCQNGHRG